MNAKVKEVMVEKHRRIIAISDIHGSLNRFKKLLAQISYNKNDILILVGDLIEKGEQSLETLRYIMKLSLEQQVYTVSGNCDTLWEDIKSEEDGEGLLRYMLFRENSILNEMCRELSIDVNEKSDINHIKIKIRENFISELNWLENLPHIITLGDFIFAHAGITSEEKLEHNNADEVMKRDAFISEGLVFSKYVIVGHWPTANYGKERGCCNPIINEQQKIISIDGGNNIKSEGQLNALIIQENSITFHCVDGFPKGKVIKNQEAKADTIQITWMDNNIQVLEQGEEFTYCRHVSSNHELWVKNDRIFQAEDGIYRCYDATDYFIEAHTGDMVSIVEQCSDKTLVKRHGVIGWLRNDCLEGGTCEL
ncbi:Calcineurin-like phosphoesterase [Hathewaya proteolytica DSM 3090]|uniref:Calcineurin-like phosphoesterase n=1 Tax=Hathewaya proteolytica DSM 3090 TaxID=1121331 RepID=A0A1M6N436_9CLOT|nr:metallophosphoesterase [Hathewaya proteolytica]SHJ90422.1 Calcineurin-like phosphoesterase [Hathewaya proteolytica DSM 3090]